jgi:hypothetical protein
MRPTVRVFYSYAHEDEALRDELEKHLSLMQRQGIIQAWHTVRLPPAAPGRMRSTSTWKRPS